MNNCKNKKIVIAIDGYSSCGKSTLARDLAKKLGYSYIDSGAMYRAITLYFIRENVDMNSESEISNALKNINLEFDTDLNGNSVLLLNGEDVSMHIRDLVIAERVSQVAAIKAIRQFAVERQKALGQNKSVVMDGRDIGTVVFPNAELKIFVTADLEVRIKRRYLELMERNTTLNIDDVRSNLVMRDYIDSNREESPLRMAEDARLLNNSDMDRKAQLQKALDWVNEVCS